MGRQITILRLNDGHEEADVEAQARRKLRILTFATYLSSLLSIPLLPVPIIICLILERRRFRHKKMNSLAQSHTVSVKDRIQTHVYLLSRRLDFLEGAGS